MHFDELHIETRRERPAHARSEGESLLRRAGYLDSQGQLTLLGARAIERIRAALQDGIEHMQAQLGLPLLRTADAETVVELPLGNFDLLHCRKCGYTASAEMAKARKVPGPSDSPRALQRVPTLDCSTIESLANVLGIPTMQTAKALLYVRPGTDELIFVIIRGDMQLSEAKLCKLVGDVQPASKEQILNAGAVPGYASPIGLRHALIAVDDLIPISPNLVAGANEPGYHLLNTNYERDYLADLVGDLAAARPGDPCSVCGSPLESSAGLLLSTATEIHYENVLQALAEMNHDDHGLRLPVGLSPFDVYLMHLASQKFETRQAASALHDELEAAGIYVLLDDRDERAGVKFNDADLLGFPLRVTVGEKNLANRMVELKARSSALTELVPVDGIASRLQSLSATTQ